MTYLAIPGRRARNIQLELLREAPLESGAFCRLDSVRRNGTARLVLGEPIESPEPWTAQEDQRLTPSGRRISSAISVAASESCGLAFIHTHPMSRGIPSLSGLDRETTQRLGKILAETLDGPFASLVVSEGGWGGMLANADRLLPLDRIACVSRTLDIFGRSRSVDRALDSRQVGALGLDAQRRLRSLRVAIVGAGGVGSPVAETLARMGVAEIRLIDHDDLDTPSNARRVFGVGRTDAEASPPLHKARAVVAGLERLDLGTTLKAIVGDIRDPEVQERLLDVDLIVNGTDTHGSRASVSELAMRAVLPLIDVGVRVGVRRSGALDALRLERRVQLPDGPCLWCWGSLDPEQIRLESMTDAQRQGLVREGYVAGSTEGPVPSVAALTVTAAGVATSALLGLIAGAFETAPLGVSLDALTLESVPFRRSEPDPACICSRWR